MLIWIMLEDLYQMMIIIFWMFDKSQDEPNGFKKKREEFSKNIRKTQRTQKMRIRRQIPFLADTGSTAIPKIILDKTFQHQIQGFLSKNYQITDLFKSVSLMNSQDLINKHEGVIGVRKIICKYFQNVIQYVSEINLIPLLIEFMNQKNYIQLSFQAAWALTNLSMGGSWLCCQIVKLGALSTLIDLVGSDCLELSEQGVWAIGNIAAENPKYRDCILQAGGLDVLIKKLNTLPNQIQIQNFAWALSNLCRGKPEPKYQTIKTAIPIIIKLLVSDDLNAAPDILCDCLWALFLTINAQKKRLEMVCKTGLIKKLVKISIESSYEIRGPCFKILCSCSKGNNEITQQLIDAKFLDFSPDLLTNEISSMRRQTAFIISNIAAGTYQQVQFIIFNEKLMNSILTCLKQQKNKSVKLQIIWILANLCRSVPPVQMARLVHQINLIGQLVEMIQSEINMEIQNGLDCLYRVLMCTKKAKEIQQRQQIEKDIEHHDQALIYIQTELYDRLFELREHQNKEIQQSANRIINKFLDPYDT